MDDSRLHILICRSCGRPHDPDAAERGMGEPVWHETDRDSVMASSVAQPSNPDRRDSGATLPMTVELNVLAGCNGAYDRAVQAGAAEVGLLDLLYVVASTVTLEAWLVAYDIDRDLLRIEIETLESTRPDRRTGGGVAPVTSLAMKQVLGEARANAERRQVASVTIGELLIALADNPTDAAGGLLANHIERQRQRRRGGMRSGRADTSRPFGALHWRSDDRRGGGDDSTSPAADGTGGGRERDFAPPSEIDRAEVAAAASPRMEMPELSDTPLDWVQEELRGMARQAPTAAAAWDGAVDARVFASRRHLDHIGQLDVGAPATYGIGGHAGSAGFDDLYRPGEREPADGWHRAPSWLSQSTGAQVGDFDSDRGASRDIGQSDAGMRQLMVRLAEWQAEMASRLDEQDLQLEGIAGQLASLANAIPEDPEDDDGVDADAEAGEAGDDDVAAAGEMLGEALPPAAPARIMAKSNGPAVVDAAAAKIAATMAQASSIGAGSKNRRYLDRATIRKQMRRTLSKRRAVRAAASNTARIAAAAHSQSHLQDESQLRMATPSHNAAKTSGSRSDLATKQRYKAHLSGGYPRSLPDDDETEDLEGNGPQKRFYLSMDDDIVEAPSIGPKTADRLRGHGIGTVRDLLSVKAQALSARVGVRHITAEKITSWQHQARLVCTIPWLRGTHAQILVGSGYYAPHSIVTANRDALCTAILRFSTTREGQSVLRSAPPPSLGKIMRWVEQAALAEADRAT